MSGTRKEWAEVKIGDAPEAGNEISPESPFLLALLGNFSGAPERCPLSKRKPIFVDRDNFEDVLRRFDVSIAGMSVVELDDFHPDTLYRRLPVFEAFRSLRERLEDPESFGAAAAELLQAPSPPRAMDGESLLDMIIGGSVAAAPKAAAARKPDDLQQFVRDAVRPYLVPRQDPRAPELIRQVDEGAAAAMRGILHDEAFQSLESAWRTVYALVRRLETGADLRICLVDVTKDEISQQAEGVRDLLVTRSGGWSVLAACFSFGTEDLSALRSMAGIARRLRAPFLGEAALSLLDGTPAWAEFRRTAEAAFAGLALPRILLRLPYGRATSPCETFGFEELPAGRPDAQQLLWASPAPFCAMLIAEAGRPGPVRDIQDLPVYVFREDGESLAIGGAELVLTEDAAEALLDNGIMPVVATRGTDQVRILRFQAVADPLRPLAGRWE